MEYFKKGEIVGNKRMPEKSFVEMYPITKECEERPPLMIVIPGGGYHHLADHEGKDIAEWCNEKGMDAAVFYYQLQPFDIELLLEELNNWIYSLKNPSNQLDKSINQIGIIGFSAGGHLAALAGTKNHNKPDFLVLSYPVITLEEPFTHEGSRTQLVGAKPSEANRNLYSPDQWVSSDTPPVFLWHTANDQSVAVENSLLFSLELSKKNVPFELHVFPEGRHGLGLAKETPGVDQWPHLLEKWLIKKKKGNKEYA